MRTLDRSSLVWGAIFCTVGIAYLFQEFGAWTVQLGVLLPLVLIVGGVALAISAVTGPGRTVRG